MPQMDSQMARRVLEGANFQHPQRVKQAEEVLKKAAEKAASNAALKKTVTDAVKKAGELVAKRGPETSERFVQDYGNGRWDVSRRYTPGKIQFGPAIPLAAGAIGAAVIRKASEDTNKEISENSRKSTSTAEAIRRLIRNRNLSGKKVPSASIVKATSSKK
jgi:hypothetical protein